MSRLAARLGALALCGLTASGCGGRSSGPVAVSEAWPEPELRISVTTGATMVRSYRGTLRDGAELLGDVIATVAGRVVYLPAGSHLSRTRDGGRMAFCGRASDGLMCLGDPNDDHILSRVWRSGEEPSGPAVVAYRPLRLPEIGERRELVYLGRVGDEVALALRLYRDDETKPELERAVRVVLGPDGDDTRWTVEGVKLVIHRASANGITYSISDGML